MYLHVYIQPPAVILRSAMRRQRGDALFIDVFMIVYVVDCVDMCYCTWRFLVIICYIWGGRQRGDGARTPASRDKNPCDRNSRVGKIEGFPRSGEMSRLKNERLLESEPPNF